MFDSPSSPPRCTGTQPPVLTHPCLGCRAPSRPEGAALMWGAHDAAVFSSDAVSSGLSAHSLNTMHHGREALPGQSSRGKRQGPPEVGGEEILLGVFGGVLFVPASARECWGLLVPTSWSLWRRLSSGSVPCGQKPRSEPGLPAAPVEAKAVGSGSSLQPAARQEAPQGGAGAQIAAASKVEALPAGPAPRAPGYLQHTAAGVHVVQPEAPGFPGYLPSPPPPRCPPACAHGLHSHWGLGPSWTSEGNE